MDATVRVLPSRLENAERSRAAAMHAHALVLARLHSRLSRLLLPSVSSPIFSIFRVP